MDTEVPNRQKKSGSIAIWAITPNGCDLGQRVNRKIPGSQLFLSKKIGSDTQPRDAILFDSLSSEIDRRFDSYTGHIFIFSTGIGVRLIGPLLISKLSDPAVVVVDDNGQHAISLVSGHLGGANALTREVADIVNATAVITTATDVNQVPAIDMIAKHRGLYIETPENIKHVNMSFLTGRPLVVHDKDNFILPDIPDSFIAPRKDNKTNRPDIYCSHLNTDVPRETLILRPKNLCVGIGCNRGTPYGVIHGFLLKTLEKQGLSLNSVYQFGTIDIKNDETGLLELSEKSGKQIIFFNRDDLDSVAAIENPSHMVEKHIGVRSVCEAAAILTANNGKLIVPKKKNKDVTIAVAVKK